MSPKQLNQGRLMWAMDYGYEHWPTVVVWRIMWHSDKHRVILREHINFDEMKTQPFPESCTLDLIGGLCHNPADRHQGEWLYRFDNCQVNRRWIPSAMAMSSNEVGAMTLWTEIECDVLDMRGH